MANSIRIAIKVTINPLTKANIEEIGSGQKKLEFNVFVVIYIATVFNWFYPTYGDRIAEKDH